MTSTRMHKKLGCMIFWRAYDDEEHILLWRWKFIRDEGDDPDPKVACRPPHHQPGPHHLSCTALNQRIGDAANLMQFIALRYGLYCEAMQNGPKFEFKWIISLDGWMVWLRASLAKRAFKCIWVQGKPLQFHSILSHFEGQRLAF